MATQTKIDAAAKALSTPVKVRRADSTTGYTSMDDAEKAHAKPGSDPVAARAKARKARIDSSAVGVEVNDRAPEESAAEQAVTAVTALAAVLPKDSPKVKAVAAFLAALGAGK